MNSRLSLRPDTRALLLTSLLALTACGKGCGCGEPSAVKPTTPPSGSKATPASVDAPSAPDKPVATEPAPAPKLVEASKLPEVVAEVNGRKVSKEKLVAAVENLNPDYAKLPPEQQSNLIRSTLSDVMTQEMLDGELAKRGVSLDEQDLKKKLDTSFGLFGSSPEEIEANLKNSRIREVIEIGARSNSSLEALYRDEVLRNITVSESEIRDYYDKNIQRFKFPPSITVRIIRLMAATPEEKSARRPDAEAVLKRIKAGEDFGQVALAVSEDAGSKAMMGFNEKLPVPDPKTRQNDAYYDWLYFSSPGQVSDVMEYEDSLIILKNDGLNPGKTIPYEEARSQIEFTLMSARADTTLEEFGQQLYDKAEMDSMLE